MTISSMPAVSIRAYREPSDFRLPCNSRILEDLKFFEVERHDLFGIVGEEQVVSHPSRGASGPNHLIDLFAQIPEITGIKENKRHAGANTEFEITQFNPDFLERADATDVEDTEILSLIHI